MVLSDPERNILIFTSLGKSIQKRMSPAYQEIDSADYICFGIALCANVQGMLISPILLKKDWKRNIVVVFANLSYFLSNMLNFGQKSASNCAIVGAFVQFFLILGSILEVHTPVFQINVDGQSILAFKREI